MEEKIIIEEIPVYVQELEKVQNSDFQFFLTVAILFGTIVFYKLLKWAVKVNWVTQNKIKDVKDGEVEYEYPGLEPYHFYLKKVYKR